MLWKDKLTRYMRCDTSDYAVGVCARGGNLTASNGCLLCIAGLRIFKLNPPM